jgi:hypothetical protein
MNFAIASSRALRLTLVVSGALLLGAGNCGGGDDDRSGGDEGGSVDPCAVAGACGGGGGGTGGTGGGGTGGGDIDIIDDGLRDSAWVEFENEVVQRVNALRAQGGTCGSGTSAQVFPPSGALRIDSKLVDAARGHADDMAARNYFSHDSLDGSSPFDRMIDAGYTGFAAAENIAAGQTTPAAVVEGWRLSPGHCVNMYEPDLNEIGVGYTFEAGDQYRHYWVQNFGQR